MEFNLRNGICQLSKTVHPKMVYIWGGSSSVGGSGGCSGGNCYQCTSGTENTCRTRAVQASSAGQKEWAHILVTKSQ